MRQLQSVSSDDICLRPHGVVASRTPSRGDSAADAVLDKDIKPVVLQQQQQQQQQVTPTITPSNGPW